jgi:hypothetical protein
VSNDFTPDPTLATTDFTPITTHGLAPKSFGAGAAKLLYDPLNGVWSFVLNEPAGGLNFICTGTDSPPQVAYGYIVYNDDSSTLIAMARFTNPISFSHVGVGILLSADVGALAGPFIGDNGILDTSALFEGPTP